jgi:molybdopterin/thiamine biosynthesis adenylyltransferase/rhodanese-related sulfurtransferase
MRSPQESHRLEVDPRRAREMQDGGVPLLDIRSAAERVLGVPRGAIPAGDDLVQSCRSLLDDPGHPILLICNRGISSRAAAQALRSAGFAAAISVRHGFEGWMAANLPAEHPGAFEAAQAERYARHLVMPEIGPAGQSRLLGSSALLVGVGGLGSPAAQYLAAAGVGRIGLVDPDRVERSNLQRQIIHDDHGVGMDKTRSATRRLQAINPDITVEPFPVRLESANVESLLHGWDVVIDGSDNFPTRYLLNDACVHLGLPLVYGAVMRFTGQVSVFWPAAGPGRNPCYRCLFPAPPDPADAPDCETAGVLGILPGIIGTLQAAEALKLLLGIGEPLTGTLLRVDALAMRFTRTGVPADPACRWCAPAAEFPGYIDYEAFCRA